MTKITEKLIAYTVVQRQADKRKFWIRIGEARDTPEGLEVQLDALPVNGALFIRPLRPGRPQYGAPTHGEEPEPPFVIPDDVPPAR